MKKKTENQRWLEWMARGEQAFKDGKGKDAISEAGLYNLGARNAWLIGWRNAGGDIFSAALSTGRDEAQNKQPTGK